MITMSATMKRAVTMTFHKPPVWIQINTHQVSKKAESMGILYLRNKSDETGLLKTTLTMMTWKAIDLI
jgi:hypothetical protein